MGAWRADIASNSSARDASMNAILGLPAEASTHPADDFAFVHPDDRNRVAAAWNEAVRNRGAYSAEFRIARRDGALRWVRDQGRYTLGANGSGDCLTGMMQDITASKQAEERQTLLIQELNHRVKNMLASIQSIAMQSLSKDEGDDRHHFLSRIHALATCHNLLTDSQWDGASLKEIVHQTFAPHAKPAAERVNASGPDAVLSSRDALSVTLALHELATNALKYGAFSNDSGRIDVSWAIRRTPPKPALQLAWRETGGPPVADPKRRGFGSKLLNSLAAQSGAAYACEYPTTGFKCELTLPLEKST